MAEAGHFRAKIVGFGVVDIPVRVTLRLTGVGPPFLP